MTVKNIATGKIFVTTKDVWENAVVRRNQSDRYEILEDEQPTTIKSLSSKRLADLPIEIQTNKKKKK